MEELQRDLPKAPGVGEIFQLLRSEPMTRAQLCAVTGQARSTVAARLDSLLETGLIGQRSERSLAMGRPASAFFFRRDAGLVLAIDVGASHVRVGLTDLGSRILGEKHVELPVTSGPTVVLGTAIDLGRELLAQIGRATIPLFGVGIGIPGPVDHTTGRPSSPPIMPGWDGWDVPATLREAFQTPVFVDNDANLMAVGEHALAWRDTADLLFVKFATGVGAGIIMDGRIRRGAQGSSGDIGHVRVPGGQSNPCHCGGVGCLEAVVGAQALIERLHQHGIDVPSAAEFVSMVRAGDKVATAEMREVGRIAGEVLAGVVSLLNPSVIAIGGVLARAPEQLIAGIRETVYAKSLPLATQNLRIAASVAGVRAGIIGASTLVCDQVLSIQAVEALVESRDTVSDGRAG